MNGGGNGTRSRVLAGEIPRTEEPGRAAVQGVTGVRHNLATEQ